MPLSWIGDTAPPQRYEGFFPTVSLSHQVGGQMSRDGLVFGQ
jgi:hypothetical protein